MARTAALPFDELAAVVAERRHSSVYGHISGQQLDRAVPGEAWTSLPFRPVFIGDTEMGVLHGGVITAMLDESCGMAVELALDGTRAIATLDLRIDYQKPAIAGLAVARRAAIARNLRTLNRSDCYPFFTNGQALAERGRNASLPGMISRSL